MKNREAVIKLHNEVGERICILTDEIDHIKQSLLSPKTRVHNFEKRQRMYSRAIRLNESRERLKWTKKELDKILMGWVW